MTRKDWVMLSLCGSAWSVANGSLLGFRVASRRNVGWKWASYEQILPPFKQRCLSFNYPHGMSKFPIIVKRPTIIPIYLDQVSVFLLDVSNSPNALLSSDAFQQLLPILLCHLYVQGKIGCPIRTTLLVEFPVKLLLLSLEIITTVVGIHVPRFNKQIDLRINIITKSDCGLECNMIRLRSPFCTLPEGLVFSQPLKVTNQLVSQFSQASRDFNPLHLDQELAKNSRFGKRIAHGMVGVTLLQAIVRATLPGFQLGRLSCKFRAPVYIDDEIIGALRLQPSQSSSLRFVFEVKKLPQGTLIISGEGELLKCQ